MKTAKRSVDTHEGGVKIVVTKQELRNKYTLPPQPPDWPQQLGEAAFQGSIGNIVRAIMPHTEADPAAVLSQLLVACGNAAGRGAHFHVGETRHGINLYTVIVGDTAKTRKGDSSNFVLSPFRAVDADWANKQVHGGLSTGQGLIALAASADDPNAQSRDKRFLFLEDEFTSVLRRMRAPGNTLSATLRQAWNGGTLRLTTRHSPLYVSDAHISLIGHVTRPDLLQYLSRSDIFGGLFNRILWVCARRSKLLPDGARLPQQEFDRLVATIRNDLKFASRNRIIDLSQKARTLWHQVYYELTTQRKSTPLVDAVTARGEPQVRRIATIYALMDLSPVVKVHHLRAGLEVWRFADDSARFIFGQAEQPALEERILELLIDSEGGLNRTDISGQLSHHFTSDQITSALETLRKGGRATPKIISTGGRSAEFWTATT